MNRFLKKVFSNKRKIEELKARVSTLEYEITTLKQSRKDDKNVRR